MNKNNEITQVVDIEGMDFRAKVSDIFHDEMSTKKKVNNSTEQAIVGAINAKIVSLEKTLKGIRYEYYYQKGQGLTTPDQDHEFELVSKAIEEKIKFGSDIKSFFDTDTI